ncbi:MAG: TetR/AcrR family transcriptional regulator [Alphaproteobacteria bacterium]|nr:TetR/AcrR family transcriptional regulator [Alphaproteobacteria bacterium]
MGTTKATDPVDQKLLELAAQHIRRYGPKKTTIVAIAEEAGMSHANIYRYFPSKHALVDAVIEQWLKPIEKGMKDITDSPDPARDKLERLTGALFRAYRRKLEDDPELFDIFVTAALNSKGLARRHRNRIVTELRRMVEDGIASGSFTISDSRMGVLLILDGLSRFLNPVSVSQDREATAVDLEARMEKVSQIIFRSIASDEF